MFKVGDFVTRISHNNDVVFRIEKIIDNMASLKGVNIRLCADCSIEDLKLNPETTNEDDRFFFEKLEEFRTSQRSEYFYIPGKILHIDADHLGNSKKCKML